jgi:peptidoglycan hydrolase-like protein with peptidoglycan-binding domain
MTRTYTGTITFNATTGTSTITSNGKALDSSITFNGVGGVWQLGDDFTTGSTRTVTLTNGTLDANNKNITMGIFSSSNSNVRTINMGSGTWTLTGSGTTIWTTSTVTNLTFNRGNDVVLNYSGSTGTRTVTAGLTGGSESYAVGFKVTAGSDTFTVSSSNSQRIHNLIFDGFTGTFSAGSRNIYGNFTITSNSSAMTVTAGSNTTTFAATSGAKTITTSGKTLDFPITFDGVGGTWQLGDDLTIGSTRIFGLTNGTFNANGKNVSAGFFSSSNANVRGVIMGSGQWTITGNSGSVWNTGSTNYLSFTRGNPIIFNYSGSTGTRNIISGAFNIGNAPDMKITAGSDTVSLSRSINSIDFTGFSGIFTMSTLSNPTIYKDLILSPTMTTNTTDSLLTVGGNLGSMSSKFGSIVKANDGRLFVIPTNVEYFTIIDPTTNTAATTTLGIDLSAGNKWLGGILADNGKIYALPLALDKILIIDPSNNTATTSSMGATIDTSSDKWQGICKASSGKIYGIPKNASVAIIIDPANDTATTTDFGLDLSAADKWYECVTGTNGKIYSIPRTSDTVLIINTTNDTATLTNFGLDLSGSSKWIGGVLASNGKIYTGPSWSDKSLIINTADDTAVLSSLGITIPSTSSGKWSYGILYNGKIYFVPVNRKDILVVDPTNDTATTTTMGAYLFGTEKWWSIGMSNDNKLYASPYTTTSFLVIDFPNNVAYLSELGLNQRQTHTITTNGRTLNFPLGLIDRGGTFNISDDLVLSSSTSLYLGGGTFNLNNHNITTGSINISGADSRIYNMGSSTVTLMGTSTTVWGNKLNTNQTFNSDTSTVVFGSTGQAIEGSTSFYNFTKTASSTDSLTFDAGYTQTVTGTLTLQGLADNLLSLISSVSGTKWNINPTGRTLSYLSVSDSYNTNASPITAYSMTSVNDGGNNTGWQFTEPAPVTTASNPVIVAIPLSGDGSGLKYIPPALVAATTATTATIATTTIITNMSFVFTKDLKMGQQGNDVKKLQQFLNSKGYNVTKIGEETKYFGLKTKEAIMKFQKQNSIPFTGYFGPQTRILVNSLIGNNAIPSSQTQTSTLSYSFTRDLSLGSEGNDVVQLQKILEARGFLTVSPTGHFGNITLQAVKAYQNSKGISATGYVGYLTRKELSK